MKIYTKKGDAGETGLIGGAREGKDALVFMALGDIDELNATLGSVLVASKGMDGEAVLQRLQRALFSLGAELASPDGRHVANGLETLTSEMEEWIDVHDKLLPELKNFVLPGGTMTAAALHQARAVCRRAERAVVALGKDSQVRPETLAFMNRTSDFLFCCARYANHEAGIADVTWSGQETE
jgi:cob(I)alamin adenosyltransferase